MQSRPDCGCAICVSVPEDQVLFATRMKAPPAALSAFQARQCTNGHYYCVAHLDELGPETPTMYRSPRSALKRPFAWGGVYYLAAHLPSRLGGTSS